LLLLITLGSGEFLGQDAASVSSATIHNATTVDSAQAAGAQVVFTYDNPKLQPAKYSFVIFENGSGHFQSQPGGSPPLDTASYHPLPQSQDRTVQISKPVLDKIFSTARGQKYFAIACEDAKLKVAFQGTKQLSYQGPDGKGSCIYNWSKIASIQKVTAIFESIAFTLEEGRRLDLEHKHDRLALDPELTALFQASEDGRAMEMGNIQPVLQEIINDESVLDRVRSRARKLLDGANMTASAR
jgi:hypothetical protein